MGGTSRVLPAALGVTLRVSQARTGAWRNHLGATRLQDRCCLGVILLATPDWIRVPQAWIGTWSYHLSAIRLDRRLEVPSGCHHAGTYHSCATRLDRHWEVPFGCHQNTQALEGIIRMPPRWTGAGRYHSGAIRLHRHWVVPFGCDQAGQALGCIIRVASDWRGAGSNYPGAIRLDRRFRVPPRWDLPIGCHQDGTGSYYPGAIRLDRRWEVPCGCMCMCICIKPGQSLRGTIRVWTGTGRYYPGTTGLDRHWDVPFGCNKQALRVTIRVEPGLGGAFRLDQVGQALGGIIRVPPGWTGADSNHTHVKSWIGAWRYHPSNVTTRLRVPLGLEVISRCHHAGRYHPVAIRLDSLPSGCNQAGQALRVTIRVQPGWEVTVW